jgi:transposase
VLNATRACEVLVGLPAVNILEVVEPLVGRVEITVESRLPTPVCSGCGERAWVKDRPVVELADLTCFGRPVTLRWRKHRFVVRGRGVGSARGHMKTRVSRRRGCR